MVDPKPRRVEEFVLLHSREQWLEAPKVPMPPKHLPNALRENNSAGLIEDLSSRQVFARVWDCHEGMTQAGSLIESLTHDLATRIDVAAKRRK